MLKDLENQIKNSDNAHLEQINEEIEQSKIFLKLEQDILLQVYIIRCN